MTHERKCWDCGYLGQFTSDVVPGVLCPKCGSQDTRRQRSEQEARQIALDDFLRETAAEFAKAHAKQAAADASKPRDGIVEAVKLKMSKCPHCGAAQWNDADWIAGHLWECGSLVNAGKLMQSPGCMRAELVTLRAKVAALEAEIKGASQ